MREKIKMSIINQPFQGQLGDILIDELSNEYASFTIFSAFAGVLAISFENMGLMGIDFTNWIYLATFLLVFVAAASIWIYSYTYFDSLKRKYEYENKIYSFRCLDGTCNCRLH